MPKFNRKEFGNNLKKVRKSRGLIQENLAKVIGKDKTTIGRFESGRLSPNAEEISLMCNELEINEYELFKSTSDKIVNIENSKNPFGVKKLFLYYQAYYPKNDSFKKGKFKLVITERPEKCQVDFMDYKTNQIYMTGHLFSDTNIAVFVLENYKEYSLRLEVTEIILNISNGINGIMLGSLCCTNGNYVPSIRKCAVCKDDIDFTDELMKKLIITDKEIADLKKNQILYLDTQNEYDFESDKES